MDLATLNSQTLFKRFKKELKTQTKQILLQQRLRTLKSDLAKIYDKPDFGLPDVIESAIRYTERLRCKQAPYGQYLYKQSGEQPLLYASVFAALFRHLVGDLVSITEQQRVEWVAYINSYQCEDGLFRDPVVANDIAEVEDWWGWRHVTLLALMSLVALEGMPRYDLNFLEKLDSPSKIERFINNLDWHRNVSYTSNLLQNYIASMQFARDLLGEKALADAIQTGLNGIAEHCQPESGLWGDGYDSPAQALSEGIQAGYHFWLLYWYDGQSAPYQERILPSILKLHNDLGGFNQENPFASACEDIDAIQPLIYLVNHEKINLKNILSRIIPWVISNFNLDGGAVFRRHESFLYGHELMLSGKNESTIFATWFRTLSLAYALVGFDPDSASAIFSFLNCPGYQFDVNFSSSYSMRSSSHA